MNVHFLRKLCNGSSRSWKTLKVGFSQYQVKSGMVINIGVQFSDPVIRAFTGGAAIADLATPVAAIFFGANKQVSMFPPQTGWYGVGVLGLSHSFL